MSDSNTSDSSSYVYREARADHTHQYLWQPVKKPLAQNGLDRLFELGCGNGAFAFELSSRDIKVTGVDPSEDGICIATNRKNAAGHGPDLFLGNAYDDLAARYSTWPCVVSLEVVEHVYFPRKYAKCVNDLLEPGGIAIISTPYHSYVKNLALALTGKMDQYFTALWDHGHIKFWSIPTLTELSAEQALHCEQVQRVGRFKPIGKSMICVFRKK